MKTVTAFHCAGQRQIDRTICVDVSKASFTWLRDDGLEGLQVQQNQRILDWLRAERREAEEQGFGGLRIVCEPTGGYHQRLLRLARSDGCRTALVSGEQVSQMQVVESNDTGKSDQKDPHTMMLLVRWGKTLKDRFLAGDWAALRELNCDYERLERRSSQVRNRIHGILLQLFPDLSFKKDWLFESSAARLLVQRLGLDPNAICALSAAQFARRFPSIRPTTLARLQKDAQLAILQPADPTWRVVLVQRLRDAYEDLQQVQERIHRTRSQMTQRLELLQQTGAVKLRAQPGLIGPFLLARILAETGPLSDFSSIQKLWRYAGMNLRPHQSGAMKGKDHQAKRGRARLRYVLAQAALKLVVRGQLFGEYYHAKRQSGMPGPVAMTAVARKLLKLLFGLERSSQAFDPARVFHCASAHAA